MIDSTIKEPALKEHIDRVGIEFYSRWKEFTLDSISSKITDGAHLSPKDFVNGRIMFSVKDMIDNGFDYSKPKTISQEDFNSLERQGCKPEIDDILIAKDGSVLKHIFKVINEPDYVLLSSIAIVKPIKEIVDPSFLVYTLKSPIITDTILTNFVSGSGVPRIVLKDFKKVVVSLPPLSEQTAIASILSSLDDKIDLLQRQNKTLEQLAETLFRQWFVEEADESEVIKLGAVIKTSSGGTPSRSKMEYYQNGTIKWVKSKELQGSYVFDTEEKITDEAVKNSSAKLFPANTILIAMYGATVGEYAILAEPATCNQAVCGLIPNDNFPYTFLFVLTKYNKENLIGLAGGSAQQNISQELIKDIEIPNSVDKIKEFHRISETYFDKIKSNQTQIRTLTQTRDTLLPKLMSGEMRVEVSEL